MKNKLIALAKPLLLGCMAFSWWITLDYPSAVFFGEYEYPTVPSKN